MGKRRVLRLSDVRVTRHFQVIAAPIWSYRWSGCNFKQVDALWGPFRKKLKQLRDEHKTKREACLKELDRKANDAAASQHDREGAKWASITVGIADYFDRSTPRAGLSLFAGRAARKYCRVCRTEFIGYGKTRSCSDACAKERRAATRTQGKPRDRRVEHEARRCEVCAKSFIPKRADAKFCTVRCRVAAHRRQSH